MVLNYKPEKFADVLNIIRERESLQSTSIVYFWRKPFR
ncbi:MAG: hypothetical protein JWO06_2590 [Bacteroidota bacterium]|nr:hypothetical protein [Bacteroidota bacterium]